MKTGRNEPCPCGSGKKYKKCCLDKFLTPPENLHYRRFSDAFNELMPKLVDYGLSVFGEKAPGVAYAEFFGWPEPGEVPDEEAFRRADVLFWPWFVFNWEYEENPDDEEQVLNGPEEATIAELYLEDKVADPNSFESRLIHAANRQPYSFWEIMSVRPGQSIHLRDVLIGEEITVQEKLGSSTMKSGDILYASVARIDSLAMLVGSSAFALPPSMKPYMIELRKAIGDRSTRAVRDDLLEWDLEIRDLFFVMDQALHDMPEMRNTDGDPIEFHKLVYDIVSADLAVEKLAHLSVTKDMNEICAAAEKDQNGRIRQASFDWGRSGNPLNRAMPNTILGKIEIDGKRMTATVNSAQRAQAFRKEVEKHLQENAVFRLDEISHRDAAISSADPTAPFTRQFEEQPEVREFIAEMLRAHWHEWVDMSIPALGGRTPKQAVRSAEGREAVEALLLDAENLSRRDPQRFELEKQFIAEVRRKLRLDRPLVSGCGNIDPEHLNERIGQVKKLITEFGNQRLHDTYTAFALQLCDTVADDDQFNLHRGRVDIWAAAIVYAIAQLNFLFSSETPNHLTPDELCSWFGVKKSTVSAKAGAIRSELDLFYDDERFCAPHITHMLQFFEDENGWVLPAAVCEKEGDARHAAPELKSPIGVAATAPGKSNQSEKPDKKEDDRQLPLFPES